MHEQQCLYHCSGFKLEDCIYFNSGNILTHIIPYKVKQLIKAWSKLEHYIGRHYAETDQSGLYTIRRLFIEWQYLQWYDVNQAGIVWNALINCSIDPVLLHLP